MECGMHTVVQLIAAACLSVEKKITLEIFINKTTYDVKILAFNLSASEPPLFVVILTDTQQNNPSKSLLNYTMLVFNLGIQEYKQA